jgi:hypothetical protein
MTDRVVFARGEKHHLVEYGCRLIPFGGPLNLR